MMTAKQNGNEKSREKKRMGRRRRKEVDEGKKGEGEH
jgi:hypothetical protein